MNSRVHEPDSGRYSNATVLLLCFDRRESYFCSWIYLIYMDWGLRHMDVGRDMIIMPAMQHWTAWDLVLVFLMWAVMMVAMMVPLPAR